MTQAPDHIAPHYHGRTRHRAHRRSIASIPFLLAVAAIVLCAIGGGSPRTDPVSLLYVRPGLAILLAALILVPGGIDARTYRWPLALLAAWAAVIAIQLIPLPPALWLAMPGHARFAAAAEIAGAAQPWRPISLIPMGTVNALAALLPAAVGLAAMARLSSRERFRLIPVLLAVTMISVLLATLQIAAGAGYTYAVSSPGLPVGLFANRNHHAAVLAASLPLLAVWARGQGGEDGAWDRTRPWVALAAGLLVIVLIVVTGSRAGLALGVVAAIAAGFLAPPLRLRLRHRRHARIARVAVYAVPVVAIVLALALGRALSVQRLVAFTGSEAEQRINALPTLLAMTRDFLPFGTGFGTFDPVFRIFEPDSALHRSSFNHAHNDLIEIVLTGGIAALAVLIAFVVWAARRTLTLWRDRTGPDADRLAGWGGAVVIAVLLGASLADYPLRTPYVALLFAIATGWLAAATADRRGDGGGLS